MPALTSLPYVPAGYGQGPNGGGDYGMNGNPMTQYGGTPTTQAATGDWSWLAPFITGAADLGTAHLSMSDAQRAAGMADPFSGQRGQYQTQLNSYMGANSVDPSQVTAGSNTARNMLMSFMQNPGSLTNMPGYQFGLNQAMEGVNRGAGASGLLNSGNRLAALEDRGNSYAQSWQNQIFNQLLGNVGANNSVAQLGLQAQGQGYNELQHLAGADTGSPTAAAQALLNGRQNQQNQLGNGIAGFANAAPGMVAAFQRWMNGGGGGPGGVGGGFNNANITNPDANISNYPGTGTFNPDDMSGWMGQNSSISLGTNSDIFSDIADIPFG